MITHPTAAELQLDSAPADWIRDRLLPWGGAEFGTRVCAILPTGYEVYARVFHRMMLALAVAAGGALGSLARHAPNHVRLSEPLGQVVIGLGNVFIGYRIATAL